MTSSTERSGSGVSRELVSEYLSYEPQTGILRWRKSTYRRGRPGDIAGAIRAGHRTVNLLGRRYVATHLIWLLMTGEWPPNQIEHRNNDGTDDRWDNLRPATQTQNTYNNSIRRDNTSGYKGVHPYRRGNSSRWVAQIGKQHLGYFNAAEEAARAYDEAAAEAYGEFAFLNFHRRVQVKG